MSAHDYGSRYWVIFAKDAEDSVIQLHADEIVVNPDGSLVAMGGHRKNYAEQPTKLQPLFALAAGGWTTFYAASVIDGGAVCVESWKGADA